MCMCSVPGEVDDHSGHAGTPAFGGRAGTALLPFLSQKKETGGVCSASRKMPVHLHVHVGHPLPEAGRCQVVVPWGWLLGSAQIPPCGRGLQPVTVIGAEAPHSCNSSFGDYLVDAHHPSGQQAAGGSLVPPRGGGPAALLSGFSL